MKTNSPFLLLALVGGLSFIPADPAPAQTFTVIKSFGIFTNISGFNPQSTLVQDAEGTLYGTARNGETSVAGTVFKVRPDGSGFTVLKWFTNSLEGANPYAGLALSGSVLYGTTANGGSSSNGTVFRINTDGTGYAVLKNFAGSDGANPYYAALTLSGGVLYGATYNGGSSGFGTLFKLNTDGTGYTVLRHFASSDGANPNAAITVSGSVLYGTTENGGSSGYGTVFKVNTDGTGFTALHSFLGYPSDGAFSDGVLTLSGNVLYGTAYGGGSIGYGTVFKVNTDGTGYAVLKSFDYENDGASPSGALPLSGGVLYGTSAEGGSSEYGLVVQGTVFKINTDGTGYTVLKNFAGHTLDGAIPLAGVLLSGSVLYGTTAEGGGAGSGVVFEVNTDGTGYTVVKNFAPSDAANPSAPLAVSSNLIYGTTESGGSSFSGTAFKINTDGTGYTLLHSFTASDSYGGSNSDGAHPTAGLILSGDTLYGTARVSGSSLGGTLFALSAEGSGFTVLHSFSTTYGGADTNGDGVQPYAELILSGNRLYGTANRGGDWGIGTVFAVNSDGTGFTTLHHFTAPYYTFPYGTNSDGAYPLAGLVLSGNTLYGTAGQGGIGGNGTVFAINTDGTGFRILHSFTATSGPFPATNSDGASPNGGLVLSGNTLYGTANGGGSSGRGTVFALYTDGSGFRTLHAFNGDSDGFGVSGRLILSGSTLFGTRAGGGPAGHGTLFAVNTDGAGFAVLHSFGTGDGGADPYGGLLLSGNALYGTTQHGGALGYGTVFSLSFAPPLSIALAGTNVILSWPTNVAGFSTGGYSLQETYDLSSPNGWAVADPFPPVIVNGRYQVTRPMLGPQISYRLSR